MKLDLFHARRLLSTIQSKLISLAILTSAGETRNADARGNETRSNSPGLGVGVVLAGRGGKAGAPLAISLMNSRRRIHPSQGRKFEARSLSRPGPPWMDQ